MAFFRWLWIVKYKMWESELFQKFKTPICSFQLFNFWFHIIFDLKTCLIFNMLIFKCPCYIQYVDISGQSSDLHLAIFKFWRHVLSCEFKQLEVGWGLWSLHPLHPLSSRPQLPAWTNYKFDNNIQALIICREIVHTCFNQEYVACFFKKE